MRQSKVLAKIRTGRCARVCGLGHYLPFFVRYAAHAGYDAIWLDLEHRAMTQREVQSLLALCHSNDIDCMLRSPTLERSRLYRHLEDVGGKQRHVQQDVGKRVALDAEDGAQHRRPDGRDRQQDHGQGQECTEGQDETTAAARRRR